LNIAYNLIEHAFTFKFQKQIEHANFRGKHALTRRRRGEGANLGALFWRGGWRWRLRSAWSTEAEATRPIEEAGGDLTGRRSWQ
jgi:hypothetical protein